MSEQLQLPLDLPTRADKTGEQMTYEDLWKALGLIDPVLYENQVVRKHIKQIRETSSAWESTESLNSLLDLRRTGKTTRILLHALEAATHGKDVLIRVFGAQQITYVRARLVDLIDTLSVADNLGFAYYLAILNRITIVRGTRKGLELQGKIGIVLDDEQDKFLET